MKQFPDINEIKLLEKNSQKNGSGILYEELLGIWKFKYVWGKESDEIKNIPSSILQVLSARLELKSKNKEDQINYEIKNSINFGLLNITFIGRAELKGLRPLLAFYFEKLEISISSVPIFNKELKKPEDKKMPFFSLVGISTKDNWLCARGVGVYSNNRLLLSASLVEQSSADDLFQDAELHNFFPESSSTARDKLDSRK